MAARNPGRCFSPDGNLPPGSGKSDTPCARTQAANLTPELVLARAFPEPWAEPQAASTAAQAAALARTVQLRPTRTCNCQPP